MAMDATGSVEQSKDRPQGAALLSNSWYLQAYGDLSAVEAIEVPGPRPVRFMQGTWWKLGLALALGLCAGFGVAAVKVSNAPPKELQQAKPQLLVERQASPEAISVIDAQEAARLKARNRRLEALVEVLRKRAQEKKQAPEQTSYTGQ